MKIKYLGTAAVEAIPGPFCDCDICRKARELGGRELRGRSQALVDGKLLIEFNPDTFMNMFRFGFDLVHIRHCVVTHEHSDHFYPDDLSNLNPGFSELPEGWPPFTLYGSEDLFPSVEKYCQRYPTRFVFKRVEPFVPFEAAGLTVTALKAAHGTAHPYIYLIGDGDIALLYAHDTGIFPDETWDYLEKAKPRLGLVSMDCTEGAEDEIGYDEHMCLGRNVKVKDRLCGMGLCNSDTLFVANHFSHSGKLVNYRDFRPLAEEKGIMTSYDGMELEF